MWSKRSGRSGNLSRDVLNPCNAASCRKQGVVHNDTWSNDRWLVRSNRSRFRSPTMGRTSHLEVPMLHTFHGPVSLLQAPSLSLSPPHFPLFPLFPFRFPFFLLFPFHPPLEVGSLNTARKSGECYKFPSEHFIVKIWHSVAPILLIFLRINWPQRPHF